MQSVHFEFLKLRSLNWTIPIPCRTTIGRTPQLYFPQHPKHIHNLAGGGVITSWVKEEKKEKRKNGNDAHSTLPWSIVCLVLLVLIRRHLSFTGIRTALSILSNTSNSSITTIRSSTDRPQFCCIPQHSQIREIFKVDKRSIQVFLEITRGSPGRTRLCFTIPNQKDKPVGGPHYWTWSDYGDIFYGKWHYRNGWGALTLESSECWLQLPQCAHPEFVRQRGFFTVTSDGTTSVYVHRGSTRGYIRCMTWEGKCSPISSDLGVDFCVHLMSSHLHLPC